MFHMLPMIGFTVFASMASPPALEKAEPVVSRGSNGTGLKVVIDPVSGQIVNNPTDAWLETATDEAILHRRRSSWELRTFRLPAGGLGVDLDGWADHSLTAEVAPDGQLRYVCSQGDRHADTAGSEAAGDEGNER
jgi:hypothetical protein